MAINPYYNGGANFSPYAIGSYGYTPQQTQTNIVNMVLVNSEDEARNYQLNPGSSIFLMDSNNQLFYTKSVDFSGIATFRKYQFHEITADAQPLSGADYITREEFEEWKKQQYRKPQYQKKEREQQ